MENQNFTNVTLKKRIQKEAWDEISRRYPLTTIMKKMISVKKISFVEHPEQGCSSLYVKTTNH